MLRCELLGREEVAAVLAVHSLRNVDSELLAVLLAPLLPEEVVRV